MLPTGGVGASGSVLVKEAVLGPSQAKSISSRARKPRRNRIFLADLRVRVESGAKQRLNSPFGPKNFFRGPKFLDSTPINTD
jgi:hypothetical protein